MVPAMALVCLSVPSLFCFSYCFHRFVSVCVFWGVPVAFTLDDREKSLLFSDMCEHVSCTTEEEKSVSKAGFDNACRQMLRHGRLLQDVKYISDGKVNPADPTEELTISFYNPHFKWLINYLGMRVVVSSLCICLFLIFVLIILAQVRAWWLEGC